MILLLLAGLTRCQNRVTVTYPARLHPGQDIVLQLQKLARAYGLRAANLVSAVGSVNGCFIRLANASDVTELKGPRQILSLSGTLDQFQRPHLHISLGDEKGAVVGGHLPSIEESAGRCRIFTTLELLLLQNSNVAYQRQVDNETGFDELRIYDRI